MGLKNPYRYRGYPYDTETGLYYLQSRYYNPEWGRFINADALVGETGELLSYNMFSYCNNDAVNNEDPDGNIAWWVGAAIGGAVSNAAFYLFSHRKGGFRWKGLDKAALSGAVTGVLFGGVGKLASKGAKVYISARKARKLKKVAGVVFVLQKIPLFSQKMEVSL